MLDRGEESATDKAAKQGFLSAKHSNLSRASTTSNLVTTKGSDDAVYPSYQELKHLLNVREVDLQQVKKSKESQRIEQLETSKLELEKDLEKLQAQMVQLQKGGVVSTTAATNTQASAASAIANSLPQNNATATATTTSGGGDDAYAKYRKMLKMGMPKQSVINKMIQDKVDKSAIDTLESTGELPGGGAASGASTAAPSNPVAALIAGNANATASTTTATATATLTPEEEAKLAPYRKMQKINMPQQSIINKMIQDGIDKALIDKMFGGGKDASKGETKADAKKKEEPQLPPGLKPKKVIQPNVKMRNLHWTPLNPFDVDKTIWKDINDEAVKLDASDLESNFCWKEIERKTPEKTPTSSPEEAEKVTVLDSKRGYNVEIFLGRLKMDNWAIRDAMLKMDENVLQIDAINKLINFVPTPEEADLISQYEDTPNLAAPETYFKIIKSVDSNLKQRLELWSFKIQFSEEVKSEQEKIEAVNRGVQSLRKSTNFKKMLTYVLAVGNYMNGGTKNGAAFGFKLNSLTQLSRSRTVDNKQTLLQYLYVQLEQKDTKVLEFSNDLASLDDATTG
ncbi:hypothetical protein RFI_01816 [Reticulomyxa filosa]|uniref:FH2 domain-containing protein n=1 Tax=Reticulomyxa filosa TaxID=46433 RepID=X6PC50_RETFI|nr:hypothetical protein RFI_01816 [Reticulomyxa filosa]|eukprot:ETO35247.1 hypothetical protein RFI_01816 [Reticulomyxa filosa]